MKNFNPELIEKAKAAQSVEELLALAKENSTELTEEEAKTYFEQLKANGAVNDEDLEAISGGGCFGDDDDGEDDAVKHGEKVTIAPCSNCGCTTGIVMSDVLTPGAAQIRCESCRTIISFQGKSRSI